MTILQVLAVVMAAGILVAPYVPVVFRWVLARPPKDIPSYQEAISRLADVRSRLVATQGLEDDQKKAIDVLTLALVDGSDL